MHTQQFLTTLSMVFRTNNIDVEINFQNISLGICEKTQNQTVLNFIILCAKYFIFKCKCTKQVPIFQHFKNYIKGKIETERVIAMRKNKYDIHCKKLSKFAHLF